MLIIDVLKRHEGVAGEPFVRVATCDKIAEVTPAMFQHSIVQVTYEDENIGVFMAYNSLMKWYNSRPGRVRRIIKDVVENEVKIPQVSIKGGQEFPSRQDAIKRYLERTVHEHVDAPHYKNYMGELQWLEAMNQLSEFSNPEVFIGSLKLTIRGYLDRMGKKDRPEQDVLKAVWYLRYLAAYLANDSKPILIRDIDSLIARIK